MGIACVGSNPALGTKSPGRTGRQRQQGDVAKWLRRRSAKPLSAVRIRPSPPATKSPPQHPRPRNPPKHAGISPGANPGRDGGMVDAADLKSATLTRCVGSIPSPGTTPNPANRPRNRPAPSFPRKLQHPARRQPPGTVIPAKPPTQPATNRPAPSNTPAPSFPRKRESRGFRH